MRGLQGMGSPRFNNEIVAPLLSVLERVVSIRASPTCALYFGALYTATTAL
jgi:hypothetical protein